MAATDARRRILVLVVSFAGSAAHAQDGASSAIAIHADDDGLLVVHPSASARAAVVEGTLVRAGWEMDAITAATVDVRTSASTRGFEETRHGLATGVEHEAGSGWTLGAGYAATLSPDHVGHLGSLSVATEDAEENRRLALTVAAGHEWVGRAGDAAWTGTVDAIGLDVAYTTLLSAVMVADLTAGAELRHGYLESPYRFVPVIDPRNGQRMLSVPERVPDDHWRGAVRARLRWALSADLFASAAWRLHGDDWGIAGHTVELRVAHALGPAWTVALSGRFYGQRSARFHRGTYATFPAIPEWRTADRELAATVHLGGGLLVEHLAADVLGGDLRFDLRADLVHQHYFDTPRLPERFALTAGFSLSLER